MICEQCGHQLTVGDYPFCPHGRSEVAVHGDDVPGGFIVENGFDGPRKFYSHSEHERALAASNMEIRAKWAGPDDKIMTRWDTVDLDSAKQLVMRNAEGIAKRNADRAAITVEVGDRFTEDDLR